MKRIFRWLIIVFILIQFVRPDRNYSEITELDYSNELRVSKEVKEILEVSCVDCHSNDTEYPWYGEIAPISWYLAYHVNDGKEHLNFSEWNSYNKNQKEHILKDLKEELEDQNMPLKSYLLLHNKAKLSEQQYELLLEWVNSIVIDSSKREI